MNEQQFEQNIEQRWQKFEQRKHKGRIWAGLMLLLIGVLLFVRAANLAVFPNWFFTWPVLLIGIGIFSALKNRFRGPGWLVMLLIGGFALAGDLAPEYHLDRYTWPAIFVFIGLAFLLRPKKSKRWGHWNYEDRAQWDYRRHMPATEGFQSERFADRGDFVDVTAVFSGVKKNILTKNLKGGDVTSFMGGSEIDMTQADFSGTIHIDVTNVFGGTKLIIPSSWEVQSDITAVFGGVDDKRQTNGAATPNPDKVLVLDGTCVFGGIEIRSF